MEEKELIKKRMKLYKALGAEEFQKVVFAFEKLKFKIMDKLFPNSQQKFENRVYKRMDKELEKASTEEEKEEIEEFFKEAILKGRIERRTHQNINYHMDKNDPTEIIKYLELNKKIHINGLKINGVLIALSILGIIFPIVPAISVISTILLVLQSLDAVINFECINIQNYNLCRMELIKDRLDRRQQRRIKKALEYHEAIELIAGKVKNSHRLPSMKEIIEDATPEQLAQIKEWLLKEHQSRTNEIEGSKVTCQNG